MEKPINLLPGPVHITPDVQAAFATEPISHRSHEFKERMHKIRIHLCELVRARHVAILLGSGTLANDVIAGQLSLLSGRGIILSNGEFGERLIDHATRFALTFTSLNREWGHVFNAEEISNALKHQNISWLWAVHCETSTGVLNDVTLLHELCTQQEIKLCLDCISSLGTVPLNLQDIYLAAGVSGKGLRGFSGLALVFHNYKALIAPSLPRYLDLGLYADSESIPFTHSSNLIEALEVALQNLDAEHTAKNKYDNGEGIEVWLHDQINASGLKVVTLPQHSSPAVITIALPTWLDSCIIGSQIAKAGYTLNYQSDYLLQHNWIQICLFRQCTQEMLEPLVDMLRLLYCSE